ncbi:MAG: quinone oxidoreductase [Vulcanimicrobiaceae bacterium]
MKAIRIDRPGGPEVLQLVDAETPKPKAGEIVIRQTAIGLNFIDVYIRSGIYKREMPFILGREGAGTIEAVGEGVTGLRAGDRVAYCDTPHLGGYAEYNAIPASDAVPVPAGIDDRMACAIMLQGITAQYLSTSTYPIASGDTVLVHAAAGGVGLLLTQLAKARGATVLATAGSSEKVALARGAGADHVIDYRTTDFAPEVKRITNGAGVAVAYDSVGIDTYERSISVLRPRGYLVLFGASSGPVPPIDPQKLSAAGSLYLTRPTLTHYKLTRDELIGRANDLFAQVTAGKLKVRIGATYPLADAAQAHRDLEARKTTGKVLLLP